MSSCICVCRQAFDTGEKPYHLRALLKKKTNNELNQFYLPLSYVAEHLRYIK